MFFGANLTRFSETQFAAKLTGTQLAGASGRCLNDTIELSSFVAFRFDSIRLDPIQSKATQSDPIRSYSAIGFGFGDRKMGQI